MKLLLLTYHFPPSGGVGVQRVIKLLKYLPENGIEPVVVTTARSLTKAIDPELLALEEVKNCIIYRIGGEALEPFLSRRIAGDSKSVGDYLMGLSSLPFMDIYQLWSRNVVKQVEDIIREEDIDCIYSTSPPHSVHFLGSKLRENTGIPWIMELRDSMTDWPLRKSGFLTRVTKEVERIHEKRFYSGASGVIFVAQGQLKNAMHRVPDLHTKPTLVVPNGFDQSDYSAAITQRIPAQEFTITFTGNLSDHNIGNFCQAASCLSESAEIGNASIRLKIVGIVDEANQEILSRLPPSIQVELPGFVSHKKAIQYQRDSHCLLLLQTSDTGAKGGEMINAKIFEYLATGLPIVAITPIGEQWDMIESSNLGKPARPSDLEAIKDAIRFSYNLAMNGGTTVNQAFIESFSRKRQIGNIAKFIRTTIVETKKSKVT